MPDAQVRVLYVDDDEGIARLVAKALSRRGYSVEHAAGCNAALARVKEGGIDAIGLDHEMPGSTGLDFLRQLPDVPDAPPVVYVTGSGDTRIAVAALKAGAVDYVPKDVGGEFLELLGTSIDGAIEKARLTREHEVAERTVREQRDHAELLLREVNHRVGNSLSLVAALVRMQAKLVKDPAAAEALKETEARIIAIGSIHRRLYTSADVRFVDAAAYLGNLVDELKAAMQGEGRPHALKLQAEPLMLPTDKAISVGFIVTELVTNAFKYAYQSGDPGEIRVRIARGGEGRVDLVVEDDGIGWSGEGAAAGTGLGSQVVKAMATNLRSAVEFERVVRGTRIRVSFAI